jgi:hypothetical protein
MLDINGFTEELCAHCFAIHDKSARRRQREPRYQATETIGNQYVM